MIAEEALVNDLAVNVKGDLYYTESNAKKIWYVPKGGKPRVVDEGIEYPNGIMFSPDQTLLYVSDHAAQLSWAFQIQPDGSLAHKQKYFYVHMPDAATRSSADGMVADTNGSVYIATALGVQVFDQIGKCHAIIPAPARGSLSSVKFGGANLDELYVTNGGKVFKRKVKTKGVVSWRAPIKPPARRACSHGLGTPSAATSSAAAICQQIALARRRRTVTFSSVAAQASWRISCAACPVRSASSPSSCALSVTPVMAQQPAPAGHVKTVSGTAFIVRQNATVPAKTGRRGLRDRRTPHGRRRYRRRHAEGRHATLAWSGERGPDRALCLRAG